MAGVEDVRHRRVAGGAEAGLAGVVSVPEDVARAAPRRAAAGEQVEDPLVARGARVVRAGPQGINREVATAADVRRGRLVARIVRGGQDVEPDVDAGVAIARRLAADQVVGGRRPAIGDRGRELDSAGRIRGQREAAVGAGDRHHRGVGADVDPGSRDRRAGRAAAGDPDEARDVPPRGGGAEDQCQCDGREPSARPEQTLVSALHVSILHVYALRLVVAIQGRYRISITRISGGQARPAWPRPLRGNFFTGSAVFSRRSWLTMSWILKQHRPQPASGSPST